MSVREQEPMPETTGRSTAGAEEAPAEFFSRWSRRKTAVARGEPVPEPVRDDDVPPGADVSEPESGQRIDPRTGKPYDELTDADMPDLDSLDQDSDLSAFMARNISPGLRMKALNRVFRAAKYNKISLTAEFAEDYTSFTPLGSVIPHDMKAAVAREAERLRKRLQDLGEEISQEDAETRVLQETRRQRIPKTAVADTDPGTDGRGPGAAEVPRQAVSTTDGSTAG